MCWRDSCNGRGRRVVLSRRWWLIVLVLASLLVAGAATTVTALAINAATGSALPWLPIVAVHPIQSMVVGTVLTALSGAAVWQAQRLVDRERQRRVPPEQCPEPWVVDRPSEIGQVVAALRARPKEADRLGGRRSVGITTSVHGAGGFGKTTVAKLVGSDRRVLRRFRGGVYWVTLGRDVRSPSALAAKITDLINTVDQARSVTFTDPQQAGQHLASLLASGPRRLLILDDVWYPEQEVVFQAAGRCRRLITTRIPTLVTGRSVSVKVDQVSDEQARAILTIGLPPLGAGEVQRLLAQTGRWALLLRLINKFLVDQARIAGDITAIAMQLAQRLHDSGSWAVDQLNGATDLHVDINDPRQRQLTVAATIEASVGLLTATQRQRLRELAIFVEDENVPVELIHQLWRRTGELDLLAARGLCARLDELALVTTTTNGTVSLHDEIRDYLHRELGPTRAGELHGVLIDAVASTLPPAPRAPHIPASAMSDEQARGTHAAGGGVVAWWQLDESARYLADHLVEHMLAADRLADIDAVVTDLRWIAIRLQRSGPAAAYSDLARVPSPRCTQLGRLIRQIAHLLTPTEPEYCIVDLLYSRVDQHPIWGEQARQLSAERRTPRLTNHWPLPDQPHPALRWTLDSQVMALLAISPDGRWLAAANYNGTTSIWDTSAGTRRTIGRTPGASVFDRVAVLMFAPDSSWFVTVTLEQEDVRIWDLATLVERGALLRSRDRAILRHSDHRVITTAGARSPTTRIAISPDSSWLAISNEQLEIRDAATGAERAVVQREIPDVMDVAISPDGTWLVAAGQAVRIFDAATGVPRRTLLDGSSGLSRMAMSPDGTWIAVSSGNQDGLVHLVDTTTGTERTTLRCQPGTDITIEISSDGQFLMTHDGSVRIWNAASGETVATLACQRGDTTEAAFAPAGTWLWSLGLDQSVRVWDTTTGTERVTLQHRNKVSNVTAPTDGSWLATNDGSPRIWDTSTSAETGGFPHPHEVMDVAPSPDGEWLATLDRSATVRIWDTRLAVDQTAVTRQAAVLALVVARDGSWVATEGEDGTVRIWDSTSPSAIERATVSHRPDAAAGVMTLTTALAVAPDGSWLATAGHGGTIRIWDCTTANVTERATLINGSDATALAVAPDGSWLAVGGDDGTIRIWDAATAVERATLMHGPDAIVAPTALAIAPDSTWLATIGHDGTIRLWDVATATERAALKVRRGLYSAELAIAPDGTWLAAYGNRVTIWDTGSGTARFTLPARRNRIDVLAISPDAQWFATTSRYGKIEIWDAATGINRAVLLIASGQVSDLAISSDGNLLAVLLAETVQIWKVGTWQFLATTRVMGTTHAGAFTPDCTTIAVGGTGGLYMFDLMDMA